MFEIGKIPLSRRNFVTQDDKYVAYDLPNCPIPVQSNREAISSYGQNYREDLKISITRLYILTQLKQI